MPIVNDIKITNPTAKLILQKFSKEEISELFSTFLILVSKWNNIRYKYSFLYRNWFSKSNYYKKQT